MINEEIESAKQIRHLCPKIRIDRIYSNENTELEFKI